ncbi:MAG: DUF1003 domain-containing protein [Acidobacteria bacterium]|nr:DUF1003 domain-containing protein [Acidobacteriota bacterium]
MNKRKNVSVNPQTSAAGAGREAADHHIAKNVETILGLEQAAKMNRTTSELIANAVARFCGSITFVWVNAAWFGLWIFINTVPGIKHVDPFPFTLLTLMVSLEAIFLSTFILTSQNLETKLSERRNHLDLQINLLTEQENTQMLAILDAIAKKVGADLSNVPQVKVLREDTQPETLAQHIADMEEKMVTASERSENPADGRPQNGK